MAPTTFLLGALALAISGVDTTAADSGVPKPIALHPDNPHYFLFRGKPTVLITSGEHYGAVLNRDFDYGPYLDTLKAHGFNQTRAFSGTYREVPGSFNIEGNTLAPESRSFLSPWARGNTPGAGDGLNKFDLATFDPAYFGRLKDFVTQAARRGVVVELVLFCTMYDDSVWAVSPMNPANNVNRLGDVGRGDVYSAKNQKLTAAQVAMVRKLVTELNGFDNVYYEVCNEPYERGGLAPEWNDRIVAAIVEAEKDLPHKHLIAQGVPRDTPIKNPNPQVSVFNFHAASPQDAAKNYALGKALGDDETGGKGGEDLPYRAEAWEFMLAGGAVFSHLDFSYTCADPGGAEKPKNAPGGGGAAIRRQLRVLKQFLEGFDFVSMKPAEDVIKGPLPQGVTARVLAAPGRAYAVYVRGGRGPMALALDLPAGRYRAEWVNTDSGRVDNAEDLAHAGGRRKLTSPAYRDDIALRVIKAGD